MYILPYKIKTIMLPRENLEINRSKKSDLAHGPFYKCFTLSLLKT